MQVTSSASSYVNPFQGQTQTSASSASVSNSSTGSASATSGSGIGTYDFTDMTPNQMKSAVQALYASGKINSIEAIKMQLAGIPVGMEVDGKFEPLTAAQQESFANTPVNYIQLFKSNMAFLQQNGEANDPTSGYASDQAILAAMEGAQGSVSSVNITA